MVQLNLFTTATLSLGTEESGHCRDGILKQESIRPFTRGKIRRVLHKTRTVPLFYTSMSYLIRRVLAKPRLILDEMCRLYRKFVSYLRRALFFLV